MKFRLITIISLVFIAVLMVSFSFPDLFAMFYVPHFLFEGNIYSWVAVNRSFCGWLSATWPPLYYYTIGTYLKVIELSGLFPTQLITQNQCPVFDLILNKSFLLFAKLPFLLFHIASAWLFAQFFHHKKKWFLFWLLNPIALFVNFIEAQYDSIPIFFLLLGFYFVLVKNNPFLAAFALGIGGAYKHYPFLLLLPFMLITTKTVKERFLFLAISLIPYVISAVPSLNSDYIQSLAFSENTKMLQAGFTFAGIHISFYLLFYLVLFYALVKKSAKQKEDLIPYCFLFSSIYFLTSTWFVQRFLFLLPTLLLLASRRKQIFPILPIISCLFFIYAVIVFPGLFDHTLLRPLFPYIQAFQYPQELLLLKPHIFTLITGVLMWIMYNAIKIPEDKEYAITKKDLFFSVAPLGFYLLFIFYLLLASRTI